MVTHLGAMCCWLGTPPSHPCEKPPAGLFTTLASCSFRHLNAMGLYLHASAAIYASAAHAPGWCLFTGVLDIPFRSRYTLHCGLG